MRSCILVVAAFVAGCAAQAPYVQNVDAATDLECRSIMNTLRQGRSAPNWGLYRSCVWQRQSAAKP